MLTQEQLAQYRLDGYVLVSGLISEETIANAEAAMWFTLGMNRDDPTSWSPFPEETDGCTTNVNLGLIEHFGLQTPALLACCTPAFYEVQDQLAQKNPGAFHCQNPQPEAVWTRSVFPVSSDWNYFNGHVDGGYRPFNVFPGSFRVSSLTYLDSGVTQGGGTVIWPWSHRKLSQAAMQSPDRYNILSDFKNPQQNFDLGEPIELRPSQEMYCFFIICWYTADHSIRVISHVSHYAGCVLVRNVASGQSMASGISGCPDLDMMSREKAAAIGL